jgi:5-methylcytosine-specific restriction endonuclease McrA
MAPLNPRGGRPRTRLVRHVHQRETTCHLCGFEVDMNLDPQLPLGRSVDELIPIADNGDPLDPTNCRLAHRCCNSSRGRRQITEAIRKRCRELVLAHQGHTTPTIRPW